MALIIILFAHLSHFSIWSIDMTSGGASLVCIDILAYGFSKASSGHMLLQNTQTK